jgi:hypothetical protein
MSALTESIKEIYQGNISDGEAELATNNLLELFKIFAQVDTRLQTKCATHIHKGSHLQNEANSHEKATTPSQGKTTKPRTKNQRNNSVKVYEDNGN